MTMLAALIAPGLFFAGASAVAAPILIHLLARRRFRRIRWAAIEFLIHAERRNRRRVRLEEWLLLLLRCAAIVLIALLVARPFVKPEGVAAALSGSVATERVFVLDDSFSMAYRSESGTPFDRAKRVVRRSLETIRRDTPDDTVTIARMSAIDEPVDSGTYLNDIQTAQLLARLDALHPTERAIDPSAVVAGVVDLLQQSDAVSAAVYIISDFQRHDWIDRAAGVRGDDTGSSVIAPLAAWSQDGDRGLQLTLINVGDPEPANLAVQTLAFDGGPLVAGTDARIRATVGNFAAQSVAHLDVSVTVDNAVQPPQSMDGVGAGQTAVVQLNAPMARSGPSWVRVDVPDDALPIDNHRYITADVSDAVRILVINGAPDADAFADEVRLLTTALRPEGDIFSGNELVVADETELDAASLAEFHVVILANVYRISEPAVDALERFARTGGGIIIFLGDQVDPELYNLALYRDGQGILPARLTDIIRSPGAVHLRVVDRLHPVLRGISRDGDPLGVAQIAFFAYFGAAVAAPAQPDPARLGAAGRPGAEVAGASAMRDTTPLRPARVIAVFDDGLQHPAIVDRPLGLGRVVLVTTTADKAWNTWPDHPTFVPVMLELVRHVARPASAAADVSVGEPIVLPIDPAAFELGAIVRTPGFPEEREVAVTAVPVGAAQSGGRAAGGVSSGVQAGSDAGAALAIRWEHTERSGLYQFVLRRRDGGEVVRLVAANCDPAESDLTGADETALRQALTELPFDYITGAADPADHATEARTELWRVCLLAAACVLMLEQATAWWCGRRR